ncbi:methyltransferase type 11 [Halorubrum aidingense JCM 13560]|uniref:Methyltransferase type 11 n=1 Tax=Halorubrum aidingense JCM 13560 TaxID=1230454 RepID=M0PDF4_9EURY|nr:class I SAM-dependent methyltransferase [Halorubrum aidingense]EMA66870.1 methyltransferase type 11 [Halorubrum aidingense JCM 13560]
MGFHTFDADKAERLERPGDRYRWVSAEELIGPLVGGEVEEEGDESDGGDEGAGERFGDAVVADLGSGTGFYTDDVAPHVGTVYGVDVQAEMHDFYREKGVPENVELVASDVADLPFADGELDGAFSTMTFHEFASPAAVAELARVFAPGARLVIFDWSAAGDGAHGPPADERYDADEAVEMLEAAGFEVRSAAERTETFAVVARAP